jgi:hypothetical protein
MGGYSSGRKSESNCTDDHLAIDVRQWQREERLIDGSKFNTTWSRAGKEIGNMGVRAENGQVILSYSWQKPSGESGRLDYPVILQATSYHYGGVRYWFTCPAVACGKRVAKLYLGDKYFACRHCYRLAYHSQRETKDNRATRRAEKIRAKLEWQPGILNLPGDKPKGMHWKTYLRLMEEYGDYANKALLGMTAKMKIMNNRLSALCDRK